VVYLQISAQFIHIRINSTCFGKVAVSAIVFNPNNSHLTPLTFPEYQLSYLSPSLNVD
jgi:hypothetical protein